MQNDTKAILAAIAAGCDNVTAGVYYCPGLVLPVNSVLKGNNDAWLKGDIRCGSGAKLSGLRAGIQYGDFGFSGVSDAALDHIVFCGGGDNPPAATGNHRPVVHFTGVNHNIELTDCTVEPNAGGLGDGILGVDGGIATQTMHDIYFTRLHIMSQPCMGFEFLGRAFWGPRVIAYHDIRLIDSIFEPCGAETVSFDCNEGVGMSYDLLVQGCHFRGAGVGTMYPWHQSLEFNGNDKMKVIGNTFDRSDGWWLNCKVRDGLFEGNTFDSRVNNIGKEMNPQAQGWGGSYTRCTLRGNHVTMDTGGGFFYFDDGSDNLLAGNTFTDVRPSGVPASYFSGAASRYIFEDNAFALKVAPAFIFRGNSVGNVFRRTTWPAVGKRFSVEAGSGVEEE